MYEPATHQRETGRCGGIVVQLLDAGAGLVSNSELQHAIAEP